MKTIISTILSFVMLLTCCTPIISAEGIHNNSTFIIDQEILDGSVFERDATTYSLSYTADEMILQNVQIEYNEQNNTIDVSGEVVQSNQQHFFSASGTMYNRQHVDYDLCYIGDLYTQSPLYTVVYFEVFFDTTAKANIFVENNQTGNVLHATLNIDSALVNSVHTKAENNYLTEEQYMNLIFYYSKSPNHSCISIDEANTYSINGVVEDSACIDSNSPQAANSYLDDWITLLNAMSYNSSLYFDDYNVPQDFFTDVTSTPGTKQWKSYAPTPNGFDYRMVRCAIYTAYTGTYAFYFAMIRPYIYESGGMSFGFVQREDEPTVTNFSYRTEMSPIARKLRYVANRGMKFYPTIGMKIASSTFKRAALRVTLASTSSALDYLDFTIGQIDALSTVTSIVDLLSLINEKPDTSIQDNNRIWVKSSTDSDKTALVLELTDGGIYQYGDQIEIDATMQAGWGTISYYWTYWFELP